MTATEAGSSLVRLLRDAARVDRTQSDPVVAGRNALGVSLPLAIGTFAGGASLGLAMTIGALQTSFADRPGPYRLRMLRMLGTGFAAAGTSALAVVASRSDVAAVALLAAIAFVAGLLTAGGPSATQVGVAGVAAALILGHLRQPPSVALHVGALVLAGGAVQALLAVAGWPLGRHRPERVALAGLYRELAGAARAQASTQGGPPASDTLVAVRRTLYGLGHDHGPSVEAYRVLLDEAERIRREIVVLVAAAERLGEGAHPILAGSVRGSLTCVGDVLDEIAQSLDEGRPVREEALAPARRAIKQAVRAIETEADGAGELTRRAAAARLRALSGQLRAAVESTRAGASEGRSGEPADGRRMHVLGDPWEILKANLTLRSAVLRHAIRLACLLAGADAVVRVAGWERGYWLPLTLLVVMRPDFASTWQRAAMRVVGTIVGLLLATELVHWLPSGDWWRVGLVLVFAFGMRLAGPGNIGLTAVALSGLVVVLLQIQGVPAREAVASRALATAVGGVLAVIAVAVLLPTWERGLVRGRLAALLAAYRSYLDVVADTDRPALDELHRTRAACRLARSNAQSSVDRAAAEPVPGQREVQMGRTVLTHSHRFIHAMLSIEAVRRPLREAQPRSGVLSELREFLGAAGECLDAAREGVLTGEVPARVPQLRPLQERLRDRLRRPGGVPGVDVDTASALIEATDRVTNSLDTLLAELRRQLG